MDNNQFTNEENNYKQTNSEVNNKYRQRKVRKRKSNFGKGLAVGISAGILAAVLCMTFVFDAFYKKGYVHIGTNGDIYVQDTAVTDGNGVGSEVESKLNSIDNLLDSFYFDDVDSQTADDSIYKAYVNAYGDKYTVYYTEEEYKALLESTTGKFYGIGAVCSKQDNGLILVSEAYEDAPAYKAGIRNNDMISKVNGQDITSLDLSSAVALIKGDKGTQVSIEVVRNDETMDFTVTRDEINVKTVASQMEDDHIGYIYISQFDTVTTQQFTDAVNDLMDQGMEGLIIDIRSNPGGVLGTVVKMLDAILPDGLIVYTEDKDGKRTEYKGSNSSELSIPLAVLVNGNSASASEIFAGAVQDYGIGKIIGTQTFGKGIVQTIKPLTDGSAVKYTIAKYFTPKGQDIHGNGVTPDIIVDLPSDAEDDLQYNAAVEYLMGEMNK